jgi:transposase
MVGAEAALEIRVLHRHGKSIREVAREMGLSRNTVRRYLRDEEAARYKPRPCGRPSSTRSRTTSPNGCARRHRSEYRAACC